MAIANVRRDGERQPRMRALSLESTAFGFGFRGDVW